ncbi:MAG: putative DNA binding domain-containing protein [Lentisphaeria bacterium]|nr:putative DNA binding domain-containing protein [Lentisphaeria bacterium]
MTEEKIRELLNQGEGFTVEYKECVNGLNDSVFETVASFSNRYGGYLLLGVKDEGGKGVVIGVNRNAASSIKKNFINILNNPNKISPTLYLTLEEIEIDGCLILWVYVPISSQVEFCNRRILDRNGDADQDITNSVDMVASLYNRKSASYHERKIFPYATTEHLHMELLPRIRRMAATKQGNHPWKDMDDMALLRNAGLYEENILTGEKGFNLAAILLLGKDEVIQSACPGYRTDAIFRDEHPDRYDDRLIVETNLIDSYDLLMDFIAKHTNDKFFLIDNMSTSVRDIIAREIVSNILVHREYSSAFPAKLVIEPDRIMTENWNRSLFPGKIDPNAFTPYPKNPILAKFFVNIGRAETLGSGVRNLYKYTKIYCGGEPELDEGDVFKIFVPLKATGQDESKRSKLTQRQNAVLSAIQNNHKVQIEDLMGTLHTSRSTILREIQAIKNIFALKFDKKTQSWSFG